MGGHVFVVRGRIEELAHDAAVIPVDRRLHFNRVWDDLLGDRPSEPVTWSEGWGRLDGRNQWIVEVGDGDYARVVERLRRVVDDITRAAIDPIIGRRAHPLVALPVLGIGRGGHAHEQGAVLKTLLAEVERLAQESGLDFAVVSPERAVVAAAQLLRRSALEETSALHRVAKDIGERAKRDELGLLIGAGVSMAAGLPSWGDLITELAQGVEGTDSTAFGELSATDQAELIQSLDAKRFRRRVASIVRKARRPALLHGLLAGLDVRQAVTTNYDHLYERAVNAAGEHVSRVLPWDSAVGSQRWVLKLHGDMQRPKTIVLTRRHMVRYDAQNRPSSALLQSLLLTKHLLIVGTSLTDDNVLRLAHEVQAYREEYRPGTHEPFGTQLDAGDTGDTLRARLWDGQLTFVHLADLGDESPRRTLELLLDRAGMYASDDSSWLLDQRFAGMLAEEDQKLAYRVRQLASDLREEGSNAWAPLLGSLDRFGASSFDAQPVHRGRASRR